MKKRTFTTAMINFARLVLDLNIMFVIRPIKNAETNAVLVQKIENMKLDARIKVQRERVLSNQVTIGDSRAELEHLERLEKLEALRLRNIEKRLKLESAGAFTPTFTADNYRDPGNIRMEERSRNA